MEQQILKYYLLFDDDREGLEERIKIYLDQNEGWQPFGSPFYHPKENRIYQAMVKYEGVNYDPLPNDHGER